MTRNKTISVAAVTTLALLVAGAYFYWSRNHHVVQIADSTPQQQGTSTAQTVIDPTVPAPSLDHVTKFDPSIPQTVRAQLSKNIDTLIGKLKQNGLDFNNWMDLALNYKVAGDYDAAQAIWEYVEKAVPTSGVAPFNIGNLYYLTIHDYPRAETYFKEAIQREPTQTSYYLELAEMYRTSYKANTTAELDILKEGLAKVPNDPDLLMTIGDYYVKHQDVTAGVNYYLKARDEVEKRGNMALAKQIDQQIARVQAQNK